MQMLSRDEMKKLMGGYISEEGSDEEWEDSDDGIGPRRRCSTWVCSGYPCCKNYYCAANGYCSRFPVMSPNA